MKTRTLRFFHGTSHWKDIIDYGLDINAAKTTDPGDFGFGIYLTKDRSRAKCYGKLMEVVVDTSLLAFIPNPYFMEVRSFSSTKPKTKEEKLFHRIAFDEDEMLTVTGEKADRLKIAKAIQLAFLDAGYLGILTDLHDQETVLFSSVPVVSIRVSK